MNLCIHIHRDKQISLRSQTSSVRQGVPWLTPSCLMPPHTPPPPCFLRQSWEGEWAGSSLSLTDFNFQLSFIAKPLSLYFAPQDAGSQTRSTHKWDSALLLSAFCCIMCFSSWGWWRYWWLSCTWWRVQGRSVSDPIRHHPWGRPPSKAHWWI